jgi:hypothetical protein
VRLNLAPPSGLSAFRRLRSWPRPISALGRQNTICCMNRINVCRQKRIIINGHGPM